MADHHMIASGDRILVGVSGGPDSMVLLYLFHQLAAEWKIELGVAHLNHGLRGKDADEDAVLVQKTAASLGHTFYLKKVDVNKVKQQHRLSLEDAARRVRYVFFDAVMKKHGYTRLALGHHLDDNAEQVLLSLLRGSGTRGLGGIAPVRDGFIIRPLIHTRRKDIENYANASGIAFRHDASNTDIRHTRNHIRHRLLPFLQNAYNPKVHHHLARLADILRNEDTWLSDLTEQHYAKLVKHRELGTLFLCAQTLSRGPLALSRRLVRRAIEECHNGLKSLTFDHIAAVLSLLTDDEKNIRIDLPSGITAWRKENLLVLKKGLPGRQRPAPWGSPPTEETVIHPPLPDKMESPGMGIGLSFFRHDPKTLPDWKTIKPFQIFLDVEKIKWPLVLRFPRPGDRFTPLGAKGSQKLKKFFIDHHVPRHKRPFSPILADNARILWLVGHRMDEFFRVTPKTSQVLEIVFSCLTPDNA
ncbi:tRNA lysidine(34) synthetase TilS [Desulfosarcina sp. OttesenSCG-928-A07]|nr:tRNA lysidine(34) synthetase TilS [Desulfosarcina sp. OttesenSCG-928-G17]MDL2330048.1 tRNA lysidine(34) synthetase TilS [Desulfosarcina sp. OttesenSCG-928-A07]